MSTYRFKLFSIVVALIGSLCACQSDPDVPSTPAEPGIFITAVDASGSRAPTDEVYGKNELIKSWWLILVGSDGKIASYNEGTADGTSREEVKGIKVNPGTYTAYAFVNFPKDKVLADAKLGDTSGFNFSEGQTLPADFDTKTVNWGPTFGEIYDTKDETATPPDIPMTGKKTGIVISGRQQESFSVEVVRMYGKVEFQLGNISSAKIEVSGLTFGPITSGPITLLPDKVPGQPNIVGTGHKKQDGKWEFGENKKGGKLIILPVEEGELYLIDNAKPTKREFGIRPSPNSLEKTSKK